MDREATEFVTLLTGSQPSLYACIFSLVPDRVASHDILQEVNLTLWKKSEDFTPGTDFMAWAVRIIHYRVLLYRRTVRRDRLIFDEELFAALCERQSIQIQRASLSSDAMLHCLEKLPQKHRELVEARYRPSGSVKEIAQSSGQTVGSISQTLYRIRQILLECISRRIEGVTS